MAPQIYIKIPNVSGTRKPAFVIAFVELNPPSRGNFKHMVYGLCYEYRLMGINKNAIALPCHGKEATLPDILNEQELNEL